MKSEDNGRSIYHPWRYEVTTQSQVLTLGKVISIPYLGYLLHFGRSKVGLLMLVVLPGLIIMSIELRNLYRYYLEWKRNKESTASGEVTAGKSDSLSQ